MSDHWTPTLVKEALSEAIKWHRYATGPEGPRGFGASMPTPVLLPEERLAEGWDILAKDDEQPVRLNPDREQIARYEAAMCWVGDVIAPRNMTMARIVNAYCAIGRLPKPVIDRIGIDRPRADKLKKTGLKEISVHLEMKGVPVWQTTLND